MSIATNLLLVATDPDTHRCRLSSANNAAIIGGAHLLDLVAAGRVGTEGQGKKVKVFVTDPSPFPEPEVDAALDRLRNDRKPRRASDAVGRLGKNGIANGYRRLVETGRLRDRNQTFLGFKLRRYDIVDGAGQQDLIRRVRDTLLHGFQVDETTGPLIGLLEASNQLKLVVYRSERGKAKVAAKKISAGDWASAGVRDAIAATQAAMTAAIVAGATAGAAGGS